MIDHAQKPLQPRTLTERTGRVQCGSFRTSTTGLCVHFFFSYLQSKPAFPLPYIYILRICVFKIPAATIRADKLILYSRNERGKSKKKLLAKSWREKCLVLYLIIRSSARKWMPNWQGKEGCTHTHLKGALTGFLCVALFVGRFLW